MNRSFFYLLIVLLLLPISSTLGQTIIVDPITYEIKIIDEDTGEELDPDNLEEQGSSSTNTTVNQEEAESTSIEDDNTQEDITAPQVEDEEEKDQLQQAQTISNQGSEFEEALGRMYELQMTMFNTESAYQPENFLTREQFTKIINRFYKVMDFPDETKNTNCTFVDLNRADPTLQEHIKETCRIGVFKGYSDNSFRPFKQLTRAEFIAVTMRIYNQKLLDELGFPRRGMYYTQATELNILQNISMEEMEKNITRRDTAIYMRRLKNTIEEKKGITTNTDNETLTNVEETEESYILKNINILGDDINPQNDPQLKEAIHTLYEKDMIEVDSINNTFLFAKATRDDVAKMLDIFGDNYIQEYPSKKAAKNTNCIFKDINNQSKNYQHINNLCKMNIMLGDNENNFLPKQSMLKSQFITSLVRLIEGKLNENLEPRRQNYADKAEQRGIIANEDKESFDREITKVEIILYLHRLIINNVIAKNLDTIIDINEFMTIKTYEEGETSVYVDVTFLRNLDNKVGYINREDKKRKIDKKHIQEYPNYHITRYGEIHDSTTNKLLGSVMFIIDRKQLLYGNIRFTEENILYTIESNKEKAYDYTITQEKRN